MPKQPPTPQEFALQTRPGFLKRHKKLLIFLGVLIVVIIVALIVISALQAQNQVVRIPETTTLSLTDLEQSISANGTLESTDKRTVNGTLSYEIVKINVALGDTVYIGDVLCELSTETLDRNIADIRKTISNAEASDALSRDQAARQLQEARNQYGIDEGKHNNSVWQAANTVNVANAERDAANYALSLDPINPDLIADAAGKTAAAAGAQAAYELAVQTKDASLRQDNLAIANAQDAANAANLRDSAAQSRLQLEQYLRDKKDCNIKSPVSGTVTAVNAVLGQNAGSSMNLSATSTSAASSLFTIENTQQLEMSVSIPEYDAVNLRTGLTVHLNTDALEGETWEGTVKSISPTAENGNFKVVVSVTSSVGKLTAGMTGKATIVIESKKGVFAVPYDAVTTNDKGESVVYAYEENALPANGADAGSANTVQPANPGSSAPAPGPAGASKPANWKEIPVTTGMETDYYIEVVGAGLREGLAIINDPEGKNIVETSNLNMFMMG